jgi:putative transposase
MEKIERVHLLAAARAPDGRWTAHQAGQLAWSLAERMRPIRFLIHDRDGKFSRACDDVFRSEAIEIIRTPVSLTRPTRREERAQAARTKNP